jgi:hypothetical protein
MDTVSYTPKQLAEMAGLDPETQRDMRRKGLLDNFGETTPGGHWRYTLRDVAAFWIADRLRHSGIPLRFLLFRSHFAAADVLAAARGENVPRFIVVLESHPGDEELGGQEVVKVSSLAFLEERRWQRADVLDVYELARSLPDSIRAEVT